MRRAAEGGLDVAGVAQEVLGGRPGEEHDDGVAAGEVLQLGRLAGGALDRGVGAVDVDEDVPAAAGGERGVDLREPGGGVGVGGLALRDGGVSAMRSRWMNGRSPVSPPVVHSRSWSRVAPSSPIRRVAVPRCSRRSGATV